MSEATSTSTTKADLKISLARVLRRFQDDERYRSDERYLKLWMRYVSNITWTVDGELKAGYK